MTNAEKFRLGLKLGKELDLDKTSDGLFFIISYSRKTPIELYEFINDIMSEARQNANG